jgi:hypothetical protein
MDNRRDSGEYYPGGRTAPEPAPAQDGIRRSDFEDVSVTTNTIPDLREAVKSLAAVLGARIVK